MVDFLTADLTDEIIWGILGQNLEKAPGSSKILDARYSILERGNDTLEAELKRDTLHEIRDMKI